MGAEQIAYGTGFISSQELGQILQDSLDEYLEVRKSSIGISWVRKCARFQAADTYFCS